MTDLEVKQFVLNRASIFLKSYNQLNNVQLTTSRDIFIIDLIIKLETYKAYCTVSSNQGCETVNVYNNKNVIIYSIHNRHSNLEYLFLKKLLLYVDSKKDWIKMYRKFQSAYISMNTKQNNK